MTDINKQDFRILRRDDIAVQFPAGDSGKVLREHIALADVSENVTVSLVEIDDDIDTPGLDQADFRYSVTDSQNNLIFLVFSFMGI